MANEGIKQKITLEGEKEYSAALKEAQRNLKVLRSELKAETAELGKNATEQQKNETRLKNLKKQIEEQKKVVKTYEDALKEVRERYGDNADAVAKWEVKLNEARATLGKMKDGLTDVGTSAKKSATDLNTSVIAANSLADSLSKIGDAAGSINSAMENAFKGVVDTIRDVISQVWESVIDLAARANNMVDLAGFWNTNVTTIQKYKGAVGYASASLSDLNDLVTKINAKAMSGDGILAGISNENYTDQWEYAMAVLDALSKMEGNARNTAAYEIFGKNFTKSLDLLNDWDKVLEHLDEFDVDKGGFGLTEEEYQKASNLYDMVNGIAEKWGYLKDNWTIELFGDMALNITGNINNILDAFKEYFDADTPEEKNAALKKIEDNIIEIFEHIKEAIEKGIELLDKLAKDLQSSDNETAQAIGKILQGFADALQWLTKEENWETIINGFTRLIELWAGLKAFSAVNNIVSFMSHIGTLVGFSKKFFGGDTTKTTTDAINKAATDAASKATGTANTTAAANPYLANGKIDGNLANQAIQQAVADNSGSMTWNIANKVGNLIDNPAVDTAIAAMVLYPVAEMFKTSSSKAQWERDVKNSEEYKNATETVKSWMINGYAYEAAVHNAEVTGKDYQRWWVTEGAFSGQNAPVPELNTGEMRTDDKIMAVLGDIYHWLDIGWYEDLTGSLQDAFDRAKQKSEEDLQKLLEGTYDDVEERDYHSTPNDETWEFGDDWTIQEIMDYLGISGGILNTDWWRNNSTPGNETETLNTIPGQMKAAVQDGMKNIKVVMDSQTVGYLVSPYVSQTIARDVG